MCKYTNILCTLYKINLECKKRLAKKIYILLHLALCIDKAENSLIWNFLLFCLKTITKD